MCSTYVEKKRKQCLIRRIHYTHSLFFRPWFSSCAHRAVLTIDRLCCFPTVLLSHSLKVLSFSCRTLAGVGVLRRGCLLNKNVKICVLCVYDFSDFCGRNMRCSSSSGAASGELRRCFVAFSGRPLAAKKN